MIMCMIYNCFKEIFIEFSYDAKRKVDAMYVCPYWDNWDFNWDNMLSRLDFTSGIKS